MFRLLVRLSACCLIGLVVLPCTAPLSTCTVSDLFPGTQATSSVPLSRRGSASTLTEQALSHALPAVLGTARLRQEAVAVTHTARLFADDRRTDGVGSTTAHAARFLRLPDLILRI